jgi:hypothetical protein
MKSAYFVIHHVRNPPPQNGCRLKYGFLFLKHWFHILCFPNSSGFFTKPTDHHYIAPTQQQPIKFPKAWQKPYPHSCPHHTTRPTIATIIHP